MRVLQGKYNSNNGKCLELQRGQVLKMYNKNRKSCKIENIGIVKKQFHLIKIK